jgi:hypothetical protein
MRLFLPSRVVTGRGKGWVGSNVIQGKAMRELKFIRIAPMAGIAAHAQDTNKVAPEVSAP